MMENGKRIWIDCGNKTWILWFENLKNQTIRENDSNQKTKKDAITLFHGSKQPHEINIWKNNVSKSKLEIRNEIVL